MAQHFPADLQPWYVEELKETLPTCVCYFVESLAKCFWSLEFVYDSMLLAMSSNVDDDADMFKPELNKFCKGVQKRLDLDDAKQLLGDHAYHAKPANPRTELEGEILKVCNCCTIAIFCTVRIPY